jgi:hypothetical protein
MFLFFLLLLFVPSFRSAFLRVSLRSISIHIRIMRQSLPSNVSVLPCFRAPVNMYVCMYVVLYFCTRLYGGGISNYLTFFPFKLCVCELCMCVSNHQIISLTHFTRSRFSPKPVADGWWCRDLSNSYSSPSRMQCKCKCNAGCPRQ